MPLCAFLPDYVLLWHKFDSVEEAFVVGTSGSAAVLAGRSVETIDYGTAFFLDRFREECNRSYCGNDGGSDSLICL